MDIVPLENHNVPEPNEQTKTDPSVENLNQNAQPPHLDRIDYSPPPSAAQDLSSINLDPSPSIEAPAPAPVAIVSDFIQQPVVTSAFISSDVIAPKSPTVQGPPPSYPVFPQPVASTTPNDYTSNPFLIVIKGLLTILSINPGSTLLLGFLSFAISLVFGLIIIISSIDRIIHAINASSTSSSGLSALTLLSYVLIYIIQIFFIGALYAIAASSIKNEKINVRVALKQATKKYFPLFGLYIISMVMWTVGFFLLIVPGVIVLARIILAPLIMFTENLGPIASIKRSAKLTKGHVNEMLGALFASVFIGGFFGLISSPVSVAPLVGRYEELIELEKNNLQKPKTHRLNFIYLLGIVVLILPIIVVAVLSATNKNSTTTTLQTNENFNTNLNQTPQGSSTNTTGSNTFNQ